MKLLLILIVFSIPFLFVLRKGLRKGGGSLEKNHAPVVRIRVPEDGSFFYGNTDVQYSISIFDQEDGDSKYNEIPPKEVVLEVTYKSDLSEEEIDSIKKDIKAPKGLSLIESSNCFNCHQLNTRSTGPSLKDINERYEFSKTNTEILSKRIINGSSGVWGGQRMPAHPKLTMNDASEILKWIFENAKDTTIHFYLGLQGFFKTEPSIKRKAKTTNSSFAILTASYTDHGIKGTKRERLSGRDRIVINIK